MAETEKDFFFFSPCVLSEIQHGCVCVVCEVRGNIGFYLKQTPHVAEPHFITDTPPKEDSFPSMKPTYEQETEKKKVIKVVRFIPYGASQRKQHNLDLKEPQCKNTACTDLRPVPLSLTTTETFKVIFLPAPNIWMKVVSVTSFCIYIC